MIWTLNPVLVIVEDAPAQLALTMSTEISTAGVVPRFSSQWVVFRSSGQPTPGP